MHLAVFPGTFDPITLGHLDIIERASFLFDHIIVAIANNPHKHTAFPLETRVVMAQKACAHLSNVEVKGFSGMLIDFLKQEQASVLVRGVRTVADYDYEIQLTGMYRMSLPKLEIVLLPTQGNLSFISSTIVRDIIRHHGDLSPFIPASIIEMCQAPQG